MQGILQNTIFNDLGRIPYKEAWDYQTSLHRAIIDDKLDRRKSSNAADPLPHQFLLCEHNPVFTLGKSGSLDHLLLSEQQLEKDDIEFFKINRGGDITYHGPGQITGYPIFDLDRIFTDVHKYVRYIEEAIILTLAEFGITGTRVEKYTGVWIGEGAHKRKICAIGVHLSRWVTMHGFAFNVNTDLSYYQKIIPCGIAEENLSVTSMEKELGRPIDLSVIKTSLKRNFASLFNLSFVEHATKTEESK